MNMVLCFSILKPLRLVKPEPMVKTTMAVNINTICIIPKKYNSIENDVFSVPQKNEIIGLLTYKMIPTISCICPMVAVQCLIPLSILLN